MKMIFLINKKNDLKGEIYLLYIYMELFRDSF